VLQCAIEAVPLRGAELDQVLFDALTRLAGRHPLHAAKVPCDVVSREYSPRDVVGSHGLELYQTRYAGISLGGTEEGH
jgi:hypothetical protein